MEGLLILIGIWVLDIVIKKVAANKNKQRQQSEQYQPDEDDEYESQEEAQGHTPPRSLQDLVRQFEEAQREASQGTYVPPAPPVNTRRHRDTLTLRDIAEVVIDVDVVNLEFLMDEFEVDENTAAEMLMALQAHRIVGRDMGEGDCDVLVHDMEELDNLLNRAHRQAEEPVPEPDANPADEAEDARKQELEQRRLVERQRQLNELEDRARAARESAAAVSAGLAEPESDAPVTTRKPLVSTKSIADVRRGFIWAKVLDEPRFKRRWSTQYR